MSKADYEFDNIAPMQRNREIEGEKGKNAEWAEEILQDVWSP